MSVISESQANDMIFVIAPFTACRVGIEFNWEEARDFEIGEAVYYLDEFKHPDIPFSQDHVSWIVRFKTKNGQEYSATQLYFVTNEVWNDLKGYFKKHFGME